MNRNQAKLNKNSEKLCDVDNKKLKDWKDWRKGVFAYTARLLLSLDGIVVGLDYIGMDLDCIGIGFGWMQCGLIGDRIWRKGWKQ